MGRNQQALTCYEEALPIVRSLGKKGNEAHILNGMGAAYRGAGQPQRALEMYEAALTLHREVGEELGEADTLSNMALVKFLSGDTQGAADILEYIVPIYRRIGAVSYEAAVTFRLAVLYYESLGKRERAEKYLVDSMTLMEQHNLSEDLEGTSVAMRRQLLSTMQAKEHMFMPDVVVQLVSQIVQTTISVMTLQRAQCAAWRQMLEREIKPQAAQTEDPLAEFIDAVLSLLDNGSASLPDTHPFHNALNEITAGIDLHETQVKSRIPSEHLETMIKSTVAVMTVAPDQRSKWYDMIAVDLQTAKEADCEYDVEFFEAVLAILEGKWPPPPEYPPYAQAVNSIVTGIRLHTHSLLAGLFLPTRRRAGH
jgi:tetratricopeptide (TPR) repeat protein